MALETACGAPAVALQVGDVCIAEAAAAPGSRGAESLLPCIDQVLREAAFSLSDLSAIAVSIGPGSFTGLRVGVATVKGLAFGDTCPIVPVPTLEAVASACQASATDRSDRPLLAVLDAQRGEFYAAGFAGADAVEEGVYTAAELRSRLPDGCLLAGPAAGLCAEAMGAGAPALASGVRPLVHAVATLAIGRLESGETLTAAELVPRYLRRAEAEVQRTGERFE